MILEKLETEGYSSTEKYDTFSRVSIRRLGRLLPDARWVGSQFCLVTFGMQVFYSNLYLIILYRTLTTCTYSGCH